MSFEYFFEFYNKNDESWDDLVCKLKKSIYYVGEGSMSCLMFRDLDIKSDWSYDLRIFINKNYTFFFELGGWSDGLFKEFKELLSKEEFGIIEVDDDEIVSLEKVFRKI